MWAPFSPFVPSVYHPCFLLCIDQICVDWVHFFLFSFCFLQNMQKLAPFLCAFPLFAPLPTQIQIPGIWVKWLCQVSSELRQIPQHDGGFQHWPHFNPSALSHRMSPLAPWLCHSEVVCLFFAFPWVLCGSCSLCWPEFTQIQARIQDVHQDAWPASSRL